MVSNSRDLTEALVEEAEAAEVSRCGRAGGPWSPEEKADNALQAHAIVLEAVKGPPAIRCVT